MKFKILEDCTIKSVLSRVELYTVDVGELNVSDSCIIF